MKPRVGPQPPDSDTVTVLRNKQRDGESKEQRARTTPHRAKPGASVFAHTPEKPGLKKESSDIFIDPVTRIEHLGA